MKCFYVSLRVEIHSWYDLVDMLEQPVASFSNRLRLMKQLFRKPVVSRILVFAAVYLTLGIIIAIFFANLVDLPALVLSNEEYMSVKRGYSLENDLALNLDTSPIFFNLAFILMVSVAWPYFIYLVCEFIHLKVILPYDIVFR
jgi:hypothetical protein